MASQQRDRVTAVVRTVTAEIEYCCSSGLSIRWRRPCKQYQLLANRRYVHASNCKCWQFLPLSAYPTMLLCPPRSPEALLCGRPGQQSCCESPSVCIGGTQCVNLGSGAASSLFAPGQIATQQQLQAATPECTGDTVLVGGVCCAPGSACNGEPQPSDRN